MRGRRQRRGRSDVLGHERRTHSAAGPAARLRSVPQSRRVSQARRRSRPRALHRRPDRAGARGPGHRFARVSTTSPPSTSRSRAIPGRSDVHPLRDRSLVALWDRNKRRRILIVEDDWAILEVLKLMLEDEGHVVVTAKHGREAVAIAATKPFDMVLMDISMPEMSGIEVARTLRADPQTADVLIAHPHRTRRALGARTLRRLRPVPDEGDRHRRAGRRDREAVRATRDVAGPPRRRDPAADLLDRGAGARAAGAAHRRWA